MIKVCAFSGHRNLKGLDLDYNLLDRVIYNLIKTGAENFLCGMAMGFDLAAAQSVLQFRKKYKISLTACIPCANQSDTFSESAKLFYSEILSACDKVITLAPEYFSGCMHERDRYMVNNCDTLVCFLRRRYGGTFYTVNYAKKLGKKIIEL